jgi:hypothetical protein
VPGVGTFRPGETLAKHSEAVDALLAIPYGRTLVDTGRLVVDGVAPKAPPKPAPAEAADPPPRITIAEIEALTDPDEIAALLTTDLGKRKAKAAEARLEALLEADGEG